MSKKEINITIKPDGTIDIDQVGWEGKDCAGAIDELIKSLGDEKKVTKKSEWYKKVKTKQQQKWKE